jgi:uncharacterized protein (DUF1501 family)
MIHRRNFLRATAAAPLGLLAPGMLRNANAANPAWNRIAVMVELKGGNDGLNTVVPYADNLYKKYRPTLALGGDDVQQLDNKLGLHPALEGMYASWKKEELAIALGCGYKNPNRSHFRSIDIWHTGANSNQYKDEGWLAQLFGSAKPPENFMADGVVLGQGDAGPLRGNIRKVVMRNPHEFVEKGGDAQMTKQKSQKGALAHLLGVENDLARAVDTLKAEMEKAPELQTVFPNTGFGNQMKTVTELISSGIPLAVIKVAQGGYDTHAGQGNRHQQLLSQLDGGLAAFRSAMIEIGAWDRVIVMTYSEFGRRVKENGSFGTDHGTAAPHFFMGAKVKGGLFGDQPSLEKLERGDLQYTMDYRCLYETLTQKWWQLPTHFTAKDAADPIKPLDCIKA